jgi:alanyl-tRNA synthetase
VIDDIILPMTTDEIRQRYLDFFKQSPRNHKEIKPSPLVLSGDTTTLFTSAGMQKLIPYLMGKPHPRGKRLVDSQPSLRTQDIEEVGDNRHQTIFEMLGNWSLGDYFKEEQLAWFWEFLTKELSLPKEKLWVSVFEGNDIVPKDTVSYEIWKKLGVPEERIFYYGAKENWWSRSGTPEQMPQGEIGGPDSEVFFEFSEVKHDPKFGKECHPNCQCGRFIEIGNSVFIQYIKQEDGSLDELPQKNVDFGGGLERISAAVNNKPDVFEIDIFSGVKRILDETSKEPKQSEISKRIIMDHIKASTFLINEEVVPSNKEHGYVLRRLIRRSALFAKLAEIDLEKVLPKIIKGFAKEDWEKPEKVIGEEIEKFNKTLVQGLKIISKKKEITGKELFDIYQSYGYPPELAKEYAQKEGIKVDEKGFEEAMKEHKEKSRTASSGKFKGGLADTGKETVRLHTATHLLHAALRKVLGGGVEQKGSNITPERLRFDFSHSNKLTDEEIKEVEDIINEQVEKSLPVAFEEMGFDEAKKQGALAFFGEKYGDGVKVYTIGSSNGGWFSKEVCGGPHVKNTKEVGRVKIFKQEKIGANLIRIYARTK